MTTSVISPRLSVYYFLKFCFMLFVVFQMLSLYNAHWQNIITKISLTSASCTCGQELRVEAADSRLRDAVTFLPLKDLRYSRTMMEGQTWFMSSMYDSHEEGEVQHQQFPSNASMGRILCIKGHDTHDGSKNYYALAWPDSLPHDATYMKGLTFISNNHYDYYNLWHGLSNMIPFVAWHIKNQCAVPARWILYHWGEVRSQMAPWLKTLMEVTFGSPFQIETLDWLPGEGDNSSPVCFENAVVMRHNEGGMSRKRRIEVFDLLRSKARMHCNVSLEGSRNFSDDDHKSGMGPVIGLTLLMRTGTRSLKNESAVIRIFDKECKNVESCRLMVAYSNNLTFCDQVKLMSKTDILVSAHGAQLTNLFFMDKNSSVMELFPKGWLELAGVGQFVFHWLASWSDMKHQGTWRDPHGDHDCPYAQNDRRCMTFYKNGRIGYNETYFSSWARCVINEVKMRKTEAAAASSRNSTTGASSSPNICINN